MSENEDGGFVLGFLLGALAGAAAALLLAPTPGEETRRQLQEKAVGLKSQAEQIALDAKHQAEDAAREARLQAQHLAGQTRDQVEYVQERGRIVLADNVKKAQQAVQEVQDKIAQAGEGPSAPLPE